MSELEILEAKYTGYVLGKYTEKWYVDGKLNRNNGPALRYTREGCHEIWYQKGLKHRVESPAETNTRGDKIWYFRGKVHNTKGAAVVASFDYCHYLVGHMVKSNGTIILCIL